jgi:hypothetical protein
MRSGSSASALVLSLALTGISLGQQPSDVRTIVAPEAEVRAGPSVKDPFVVTNRLHKGDAVTVVRERGDGWLEIRPPAGSYSWVNSGQVQRIGNQSDNYVYNSDEALPVYPGASERRDFRPAVIVHRLKKGAIVTRAAPNDLTDADGRWMPVEPPPGEVRYLSVAAVSPSGAVVTASGVSGTYTSAFTPSGQPAPSKAPSANPQPAADVLAQQAVQAEKCGQTPEAIRLYQLAAAGLRESNPQLAYTCTLRAQYLCNVCGYTTTSCRPSAAEAHYPARIAPVPVTPPSVRLTAPVGTVSAPGQSTATRYPGYSGLLQHSGRSLDERRTYLLWTAPLMYVVPVAGLDLEPYVGRNVEISGPATYRGDLRANAMTAVSVRPVP